MLSSVHHGVPGQYQLFYIAHIRPPMPPSKCPGCHQEFKDPRGFANHKRQCIHVKVATARRFKQLLAKNNKGKRSQIQALQAGDGNAHIDEGQGGPVSIVVDCDNATSMPLVRLDLLLITVYSHLNAIRMKSPASQPPSCVHLADRIERFACQSAIRMSFRRILLPSLTWRITFNIANLVMRKTSSLKALEAHLHLKVLPLSHQHITPVPIPMGSIVYILVAKHLTPPMKSIP